VERLYALSLNRAKPSQAKPRVSLAHARGRNPQAGTQRRSCTYRRAGPPSPRMIEPTAAWTTPWPQHLPVTGGADFPSVRYSASSVYYNGEMVPDPKRAGARPSELSRLAPPSRRSSRTATSTTTATTTRRGSQTRGHSTSNSALGGASMRASGPAHQVPATAAAPCSLSTACGCTAATTEGTRPRCGGRAAPAAAPRPHRCAAHRAPSLL
jgi:hypothetical protein